MPPNAPSPSRAPPRPPDPPRFRVLRDPERVSALLDPRRRRLLDALREKPDSATGLARRLGEPRQRLNYRLRVLEEAGMVELHEERQRRGLVERVLRPTALRFVVDPEAFDDLRADQESSGPSAGDRFSAAHVVALAARTVREVAGLGERARDEQKRLATVGIEAEVRLETPSDFHDFVEAVSRALAEVVARFDRPGPAARPFRVVLAGYPAGRPDQGIAPDASGGETRPPDGGRASRRPRGAGGGTGVDSRTEEAR